MPAAQMKHIVPCSWTQDLHGSFFHMNITEAHLSVLLSAYQTNPFAVCRKQ